MSFIAVAEINGVQYHVLEFELTTYQPEDSRGVKSGEQSSCRTTIEVEATDKTAFIENTIAEPHIPIGEIKIRLYRPDEKGELRTYTANESYIVYFKQKFDVHSENPFTWRVTFTSRIMDINGEIQEKNWSSLQ